MGGVGGDRRPFHRVIPTNLYSCACSRGIYLSTNTLLFMKSNHDLEHIRMYINELDIAS